MIVSDRTDGEFGRLDWFCGARCACHRPRSKSRTPCKLARSRIGLGGVPNTSSPKVLGVPRGVGRC